MLGLDSDSVELDRWTVEGNWKIMMRQAVSMTKYTLVQLDLLREMRVNSDPLTQISRGSEG